MSEEGYNLDDIIKKSFDEAKEYFNKSDIKVEDDLKLIIVESPEVLKQKYGEIKESTAGIYDSETKEIYIIKSALKNIINRELNNPNKFFIGNLFTITRDNILWPVYKNDNDMEKDIAKAVIKAVVIHEILHHIASKGDWKASFIEYIAYLDINGLLAYPEVYKIMEENTKRCERFIKEKNPSPYTLGACFANDIIYAYENILNKNKESPKLNIKDTIEKFKLISEEEGMDITKMVNTLLKDYVNIKNMLNIKANMLSCLLEKLPKWTI
ncbi:MAG: hypothetical protein RXO36_06850 [Candidatus Nanopusillus acidilobi]